MIRMGFVPRLYVTTGVILLGAGLITITPEASPPLDVQVRAVKLTDVDAGADQEWIAWYDGGSGGEYPGFHGNGFTAYIEPHYPEVTKLLPLGQPGQLYPLLGDHQGFLDTSEQYATNIINATIQENLADGYHVLIDGESGGATEISMEMRYLASLPVDKQPPTDQLSFFLLGDPNADDGGILSRWDVPGIQTQTFPALGTSLDNMPPEVFTGTTGVLSLPTIGITFNGPTPSDTPYPTIIYDGYYDGMGDYPVYTDDFLADINAVYGVFYVHNQLPTLPASIVDQAVIWQPSPGYDGDTTWYMMPDILNNTLPILDPIYGNPLGDAIIDLVQPDLRILINLGYGPDNLPYGQYPNVDTPIQPGLPDVNPGALLHELAAGAQQGIEDFIPALKEITPASVLPFLGDIWSNYLGLPIVPPITITPLPLDPSNIVAQTQILLTDNSNALAIMFARPFDALMPAMDVTAGTDITIPTYQMNLGLLGLEQLTAGNLSQALTYFGDIPAAGIGLDTIAALLIDIPSILDPLVGYEVDAIYSALTEDLDFLAGLPGLF